MEETLPFRAQVTITPLRVLQAIDEENKPLAAQSARCARLFAQHVPADAYMPLALSKLRQDALNTLSQRTQACIHSRVCLAALSAILPFPRPLLLRMADAA